MSEEEPKDLSEKELDRKAINELFQALQPFLEKFYAGPQGADLGQKVDEYKADSSKFRDHALEFGIDATFKKLPKNKFIELLRMVVEEIIRQRETESDQASAGKTAIPEPVIDKLNRLVFRMLQERGLKQGGGEKH